MKLDVEPATVLLPGHQFPVEHCTVYLRDVLQSLVKTVRRALNPNKSKKDLYLKKISGTTDAFCPLFKVKDFQEVVKSLGLAINPKKLFKESTHYLVMKFIWKENPSPREISSAAKKIYNGSKGLAKDLYNLNPQIYNALLSTSYDLDNLYFETNRVSDFIKDEFGRGGKLGYLPKDFYIYRLAQIYQEDTGRKPTVSYNPDLNQCSAFLQLVDDCLCIVD